MSQHIAIQLTYSRRDLSRVFGSPDWSPICTSDMKVLRLLLFNTLNARSDRHKYQISEWTVSLILSSIFVPLYIVYWILSPTLSHFLPPFKCLFDISFLSHQTLQLLSNIFYLVFQFFCYQSSLKVVASISVILHISYI